jgi:glycosyltransferase involved in cell wall biosynthesis
MTISDDLPRTMADRSAYMHGEAFDRNLKRLASRLSRTKVHFVGYVFGQQKADYFSLADLYVFPSRHESYGLTLLEAMGAGLPALTTTHHGSSGLDSTSGVWVVPPGPESQVISDLADAMAHLVSNPSELATRANLGKAYAARQHFDVAAEQVQALLLAQ